MGWQKGVAAVDALAKGKKVLLQPPREGGLLRRLGARSRCFCCLDPIPPTEGGGGKKVGTVLPKVLLRWMPSRLSPLVVAAVSAAAAAAADDDDDDGGDDDDEDDDAMIMVIIMTTMMMLFSGT